MSVGTYVAEFKRKLTPGELARWNRRGTPEASPKDELYFARWRGEEVKSSVNSLEVITPCPHRSKEPTGATVNCRRCKLLSPVDLYACDLHGVCTITELPSPRHVDGKVVDDVVCCRNCNDNPENIERAERIKKAQEKKAAAIREVTERQSLYLKEADEFIARMPTYPEGAYTEGDRGVVIAAGGKYWASAYITVRMLRHVGCELPVQIWYLGASGERDERYERLLEPYNVAFADIDTHPAREFRRGVIKGFQTKLFGVVNSPFSEILLLDPDCYPCSDPTVLFDVPEYKRLGAIYWPDGEHTESWTQWHMAGVEKRGPCGLETGLYVINRRVAWEPLKLAEHYDDRPEWTNGGPGGGHGFDYGDKGVHRVAWAKLKRDYVVFNPKVTEAIRLGFVQAGPNGRTPMFIHRCHSKWSAEGPLSFPTTPQYAENMITGLPGEDAALGFLEELKSQLPPHGT